MVKINILKNWNTYKNGPKSSVIVCYYLSFLPVIVSLLFGIFSLFNATNFKFLYLHLQYIYLLVLFPILFVAIDVTRMIRGKYKIRFSIKAFLKEYPEVFVFASVLIWILISCISRVIQGIVPNGFESVGFSIFAIYQGFPFFLFYAMCFCFAFSLKSRKIAENIIISLIICSTILAIFSLVDPTGNITFQSLGNTNWCSVFFNSNYYGYYLSITTILCFGSFMINDNKPTKYTALGLGTIHLLVCFLNNSLACMLSVFLTLVIAPILLLIKNRKFDWKTLLPLIIFVILSQITLLFSKWYYSKYENFFSQLANMFYELFGLIKDPTSPASVTYGTGRAELWLDSIKQIFSKNILFGNGRTNSLPHSEYLQLAEIWGLPCLTLYLSAIIIIFIKCIKNLKILTPITLTLLFSCISYLISACFGNIMPHIAPYFIMILALLTRWSNVDIKKAKLQKQIQTDGIEITDNNVL